MRPEKKAKQFQRVHELSKTVGVQRAVKAVGNVSRYGYYKWLARHDLKPISRFNRADNDQEEKPNRLRNGHGD
jgi:hypothetical protein